MIEKPKKERRFLKALERVGEILIQEVLIKIGSNLIKKIGGKKTLPSILFLLASLSLFAQYPNTGNKQRLGFQTTGDGLTWRGSLSDTAAIQPINNQNAWVILDTVNLKIYSFDFTSNVWNLIPQGTTFDTTTLNLVNRFALKLNISDTTAMLLPYAKKSYVDTAGRFYAREDFSNVTTSTLTWTQTDTLIPAGVNVVQVYRNGQILLPSQYTIPTSTSVVIAATSFKVGENYTVIFPKGGGGSGGGSGSLTSISGGTGITVSPNPITTTGTVSADLSVLMELSDTVSLSNRIDTKLNISDTLSMLAPYFRDADTSSLNLTSRFALKLNAADTASLSSRINAKGTGTVTSIATGYGLSGGTITSTGTLVLDSAVVFSRIRDSIVDVAIGNDTIKILKQEYAPAITSVLTWTITPKFPIQLKAYILVFRNGQLLINDQYNLTDTNQITIVSNSFKVGANYTVVTVSGIGSVGSAQGNPVYPEAGIAVSTGTTWTTSIPNNSSNWNIAFNDKITNAAFSGTNTKTLTLTQYDGGTFAPTFDDLQGIVAADTASMLTPYLRKADTSLLNLTSRFDTKLNISDTASMLTNYLRSGVAASTYLTQSNAASTYLPLTGGILTGNLRLSSSVGTQLNIDANDNNLESRITFSTVGSARTKIYTTSSVSSMTFESIAQASAKRGFRFISSTEGTQYLGLVQDPQGNVGIKSDATGNDVHPNTLYVNGTLGVTGETTLGSTLAVTGNITEGGNNVLTNLDTTSLSSRINAKLSATDTTSLSNRINLKYNSTGGTISGAVTLSTTSATPTALLGKDGSNVVGAVTTVAQTGLFGRGSVTNAVTDANGIITVAHGFSFTPIMAFANLPASTTNIVNVKEVDGTNIVFVVRDGATYNPLNVQTVTKIEFFGIK